jgi:hypothetical protein
VACRVRRRDAGERGAAEEWRRRGEGMAKEKEGRRRGEAKEGRRRGRRRGEAKEGRRRGEAVAKEGRSSGEGGAKEGAKQWRRRGEGVVQQSQRVQCSRSGGEATASRFLQRHLLVASRQLTPATHETAPALYPCDAASASALGLHTAIHTSLGTSH